jgi:outer membrane receptor protein involved in Fe transport
VRGDGTIAPVTQSGINFGGTTGFVDYVYAPGGSLQRNFYRAGFASLFDQTQTRDRFELQAKLQNIWGKHTFKYGFEFNRNKYNIVQSDTGPAVTFGNPLGLTMADATNNQVNGYRATNRFAVCTTRGTQIVCPSDAATARAALIAAAAGFPGGAVTGTLSSAEINNNPFLVRLSTRVRSFALNADTYTDVESFYIQDDFKLTPNLQFNLGLRWDYQQSYGNGESYLKLNSFKDNLQPRVGLTWDFTGKGKGKVFINYARFVEAPIPLDVNVRAGSDNSQTDKNFNVDRVNAPAGSNIVPGIRADTTIGAVNLGAHPTPIDFDLKPQTVNEATAGIEFEAARDLALGVRGIYRAQGSVIEDGSFDDGDNYFLFNPGESATERAACAGVVDPANPGSFLVQPQCFGRARRYYRALEFTATKRFSNNYQFIASYVYSSLTGNYEGLYRNDNGQADPNITSLFDLTSLLANAYGRLPNDRPHQLKFDGSYQTPWKLMLSGSFRAQSGIPINALIPHAVYGNNEGFGVPRGSAGRTPSIYNLDLGAYYPIQFGERRQLRFQLDWFNVFNSQRALRVDDTSLLTLGVTGIPDLPNPTYGTGTIFQFPSSLRLGVKFQF